MKPLRGKIAGWEEGKDRGVGDQSWIYAHRACADSGRCGGQQSDAKDRAIALGGRLSSGYAFTDIDGRFIPRFDPKGNKLE
jgi:hypothetical protein